ncbi:MAG: hypothetical protein M1828_007558 [Chrysothrix sp. TS-e1954]|nr:MAG: hypothetical protein M1828_007558 [Chrysothrix sp. TS-e1954]
MRPIARAYSPTHPVLLTSQLRAWVCLPTRTPRSQLYRSYASAAQLQFGQPLHETHPHLLRPGELTPGITAVEYASRRARLARALPPKSVAILAAADLRYRSGAVFYKFHQDPSFFYLTGFNEPDAFAIIAKGTSGADHDFHLLVRPKDPQREKWEGSRSGLLAARDVFNADEVGDVDSIASVLPGILGEASSVITDMPIRTKQRSSFTKMMFGAAASKLERIGEILQTKSVKPLKPYVNDLRVTKSDAEVENLRFAGRASGRAFTQAMSQGFENEKDLETFIEYQFKRNGCEESAYVPVVGGGAHANQIHYVRNDDRLTSGDLVTVDAGGEYGGYIADITRTWPNQGSFTKPHRDLVAEAGLKEGLVQLGFDMSYNVGIALETLFPHHVGHYIGLDVHDAPGYTRTGHLRNGHCITIEPGIYVEDDERWPKHFRGVGIRIEDSVCIQEEHPLVLTTEAVKESLPFRFMSSRRQPLADNPNAVNSPVRTAATKRPRTQANDGQECDFPAKKRRVVEGSTSIVSRAIEPEHDSKGSSATLQRSAQQSKPAYRKPEVTRQAREVQHKPTERHSLASKEEVKQWRRHYRKVFPSLVFYFESVPQDVRHRACKQIALLGAREEKFFSRSVTHIVTTRSIPSSTKDDTSTEQQDATSKASSSRAQQASSRTINPSLLDRLVDSQGNGTLQRGKSVPSAAIARRAPLPWQDGEARKQHGNAADILHKAKEMGTKIWALEKFDRMLTTLFHEDDYQEHTARGHPPLQTAHGLPIASKEADLSQLLRQEKQNAVVERQPWQEIVPFKGYFIYVSDMDEKVKPIMVREYTKPDPQNDDDEGDWPMLHMVSSGRCPFVPEPPPSRSERQAARAQQERMQRERQQKLAMQRQQAARSHSLVAPDNVRQTRSVTRSPQKAPLCELDVNRIPKPLMPAPSSKTFTAPSLTRQMSTVSDSMPPTLGSARANFRGIAGNPGGEPMASGLRANVTSAIRSQMISSAAATAPGSRAGTSKQMHHLQRQVLERHSGLSATTVPSSHNDLRAAINNDHGPAPRRTTRKKVAEPTLARIHEDETMSEDEEASKTKPAQKPAVKKKAQAKKEPKPGYCENCRDKYDDFNEHIESKPHKKFALNPQNWTELDGLLVQLKRH